MLQALHGVAHKLQGEDSAQSEQGGKRLTTTRGRLGTAKNDDEAEDDNNDGYGYGDGSAEHDNEKEEPQQRTAEAKYEDAEEQEVAAHARKTFRDMNFAAIKKGKPCTHNIRWPIRLRFCKGFREERQNEVGRILVLEERISLKRR